MKKIIIIIIFLLILVVITMSYFNIGIFAEKEETKYVEEDIFEFEKQGRNLGNNGNNHANRDLPDLSTDEPVYEIEISQAILPLISYQVSEETIVYKNCLDCEYNEENPEICEDYKCSLLGKPTNELNYFFCNNPYIKSWQSMNEDIKDVPENPPSDSEMNQNENKDYYKIWRCLDKYKKDLVRNSTNCTELLNKNSEKNKKIVSDFKNNLPPALLVELQEAIDNPTNRSNGIPETNNTIEDYILNNKYLQYKSSGYSGFRYDYSDELFEIEIENDEFNQEVDSILSTCFAIHNSPSPTDIVCPLDDIEAITFQDPV